MSQRPLVHHYFVDEAGGLTLFDKRGREIVGQEGSSLDFMVGVAHVPDPQGVEDALDDLRRDLLADPYFAGVPSMDPAQKKTAICFHAKDDLPEVRREVFRLLKRLNVRVRVAIRRKLVLAAEARSMFQSGQKLKPDHIYDDLVADLFKDLLHLAGENRIIFARRGKSRRQQALEDAIARARAKYEADGGGRHDRPTTVDSAYPSEQAGLQVVDYYLWAVQRLYERGEDRFFNLLGSGFELVLDLDDFRNDVRGERYGPGNPLSAQKIKPLTS